MLDAVAGGDLTQRADLHDGSRQLRGDLRRLGRAVNKMVEVAVEATGELLELKLTVNTMADQLSAFADEVTRVAREVGTEGNLVGQAQVRGVCGVWKDLTDNVNFMPLNLTSQVRNIAQVTTAVANGDLPRKITVDARGEILELKDTVNTEERPLPVPDELSAEPFPTAHATQDTQRHPRHGRHLAGAHEAGGVEVGPGRPGPPRAPVLIVDDDIRNVFALTHALGRVGRPVLYAENGREGIETLERNPDVELTLKSIARGANDYVPKPVEVDRLLTVVCDLLDPDDTAEEAQQS